MSRNGSVVKHSSSFRVKNICPLCCSLLLPLSFAQHHKSPSQAIHYHNFSSKRIPVRRMWVLAYYFFFVVPRMDVLMLSFLIYQWMENKNKNNSRGEEKKKCWDESCAVRRDRSPSTLRSNSSCDFRPPRIAREFSVHVSPLLFVVFFCLCVDHGRKATTIMRDNKNPNNPIVVVSSSMQFMLGCIHGWL